MLHWVMSDVLSDENSIAGTGWRDPESMGIWRTLSEICRISKVKNIFLALPQGGKGGKRQEKDLCISCALFPRPLLIFSFLF